MSDKDIEIETKEAWKDNWEDVDINDLLKVFDYERVKKFMGLFLPYLKKSDRILEAGCGLGPWVIRLKALGYDMSGVDYQEDCIAKIKKYDNSINVSLADVRSLPFNDGSYDVYMSWGVIEHFIEGPDKVLEEAYRVLRPGGRLILSVPYLNIFRAVKLPIEALKRSSFLRRILGKGPRAHYYQRYFKVGELSDTISGIGFSIEKIMPADHIFSLVEFSGLFRDRSTFDGENALAVRRGCRLERLLPWASANQILVIAYKN